MRCDDVERAVIARAAGRLDPAGAERLEAHLAGCGACREAAGGQDDEELAAARLDLHASLRFPAPDAVELRVSDPDAAGEGLVLRFVHPTKAGADVQVELRQEADRTWRGGLPPLSPGKWYAEVGNDRWRLSAALWIPLEAEALTLGP